MIKTKLIYKVSLVNEREERVLRELIEVLKKTKEENEVIEVEITLETV